MINLRKRPSDTALQIVKDRRIGFSKERRQLIRNRRPEKGKALGCTPIGCIQFPMFPHFRRLAGDAQMKEVAVMPDNTLVVAEESSLLPDLGD